MSKYVIRRVFQAIPLLFLVSFVFFFLVNLTPGGPLGIYGPSKLLTEEKAALLNRQFGLDQPLPMQYVIWLFGNDWMQVDADGDGIKESYGTRKGILRGDFGISYQYRKPALEKIIDVLPNTIYLMSVTLIIVLIFAVPIGIISAVKQYSLFDIFATTFSYIGQAIPAFWLGLILVIIFFGWLNNPVTGKPFLPAGGMRTIGTEPNLWDMIKHLILPVTMGMVGWISWYSRILRSTMLDVIHQDYIRTARSKGLKEQNIIFKHALKNAAIPLVTIFAIDLPTIFAGYLYVELIFAWPGMGRLFYQAARFRDYPIILAVLTISAALMIFSNLLADIAYGFLDPRIRYE
jgi:peptide/nickel transport system permease protein